ncbi:MAG TPA: amidohydrolase family protein [Gemmatimonadales bacterium]|nr:amidohydrolase family protein [Gemmatimonadales bacterium]
MRIDVNTFLGRYAFRKVPGGSPSSLLETMDRIGIDRAWLSNLSAMLWKDPTEGNSVVYLAAAQQPRFRPVPAVHPELATWTMVLEEALRRGAPAVRADPAFYGIDPAGRDMRALAGACGEAGLPLMMAVRLEDGRQRHPHDRVPELDPAAVRALVRSDSRVRLIVTHADRDFIEQVHFGSTPAEARRILWDICWIWGPPEDHLATLFRTIGVERFTFGTGMPLRLPENSVAKLDLLELDPDTRTLVESGNLQRFKQPG